MCGLHHWTTCSSTCLLCPWTHKEVVMTMMTSQLHSQLCVCVHTVAPGLQVACLPVPRSACPRHTSGWWRKCCKHGSPGQLEAELQGPDRDTKCSVRRTDGWTHAHTHTRRYVANLLSVSALCCGCVFLTVRTLLPSFSISTVTKASTSRCGHLQHTQAHHDTSYAATCSHQYNNNKRKKQHTG